jgi:hypothetical protein
VAVVEVHDGIEQASGGGQKHGIGERGGLNGRVLRRHGRCESRDKDREYLEYGFDVWLWWA